MRKIETQMVSAIKNLKEWRSGNTEVRHIINNSFPHNPVVGVDVLLHGHRIASIHAPAGHPTNVFITDAGWQTTTTKSRLNAVLRSFCQGASVFQRNYEWFLSDTYGDRRMYSKNVYEVAK